MTSEPDTAFPSPAHGASDASRLLGAYVDLLAAGPTIAGPELRALAASHVQDLVALALRTTPNVGKRASEHGLRAARLRAIKADIAQNLASGIVTAEALGRRHRVSPRYIRKLFEGEGVSLSKYVLGQRLLRAQQTLIDPRRAELTIGTIAFDAGFGDLSTFNHAFRRHFGVTPSGMRAAVRHQTAQRDDSRYSSEP
jgi:transcriptional regulator GlxA family with amidase domain